MRLVVFSHKPCWPAPASPSGYATDGGFSFQMEALSELFDETRLVLPRISAAGRDGAIPLRGHHLSVIPMTHPAGRGPWRKALFPVWLLRNSITILRETVRADALHAAIPGDVGTVGMGLAVLLRKRLFVRHCGNWLVQRSRAERFWKWFMERYAGGRNVMLATGGQPTPPSSHNPALAWIFSTSLREAQLQRYAVPRRAPAADGAVRLITVCRQEWDKGTHHVIESLPLLLPAFPDVTLDVVGDGDALDAFRARAEALGVAERVIFHGRVDHDTVMRLLQQANLFCYPTEASEGFPKVVLEALGSGLPVVTTRVSVLPSLLEAGGGILLDAPTPAHVADAVQAGLSDTDRYAALSRQAAETARQYSLERWRDAIGRRLEQAWGPLQRRG